MLCAIIRFIYVEFLLAVWHFKILPGWFNANIFLWSSKKKPNWQRKNTYPSGFHFNIRFRVISLLRLFILFSFWRFKERTLLQTRTCHLSVSILSPQFKNVCPRQLADATFSSSLLRCVYESESGDLDRVHMVKVHEANFVTRKAWPVKTKNLALKLN